MQLIIFVAVLLMLTYVGFLMGRQRAHAVSGKDARNLHSLPSYYGYYIVVWCGIPAFLPNAEFAPTRTGAALIRTSPPDRILLRLASDIPCFLIFNV